MPPPQMMTKFELLNTVKPITNAFIRYGLLPYRYSNAIKIYRTVLEYIDINECSKNEAAVFAAQYYKTNRQAVWRVIWEMEEEVIL